MSSNYPIADPSQLGLYGDEETQDDIIYDPDYNGMAHDETDPNAFDEGSTSLPAYHHNPSTVETYEYHDTNSYASTHLYQGDDGTHSAPFPGVDSQDHALDDIEGSDAFDATASLGGFTSDLFLRRTGTFSTDVSTEVHQGSVDGLSDYEDSRRQVRRRYPAERNDDFIRQNIPSPVGSRFADVPEGRTDDVADDINIEYSSRERVKKKKGRKGDHELEYTSSGYPGSSSDGHHRKRRDHEDEESTKSRRSSKTH